MVKGDSGKTKVLFMEDKKMNPEKESRTVYLDYLRVFASFAVIVLHVSAHNWYTVDVNSFSWQVFNFCNSIVRWAVPVFAMISGSLFLSREIPLKIIYTKYIFRLVVSFLLWSLIYALLIQDTISNKVVAVIQGHFHMWFIMMIIGLYMCIPFIKPMLASGSTVRYYLVLAILVAFVIPEISVLARDFGSERAVKWTSVFNNKLSAMRIHPVLGFTSYFVLGYYLNKIDLKKKQRMLIYMLGLAGFILTISLEILAVRKAQSHVESYYENFTVNVLLEAVGVFIWFKYRNYSNVRMNRIFQRLAKYSFGAYLVHALIIEQLDQRLGINTLSFDPVVSMIVIVVLVFGISFLISAILNSIPFLRKYAA